MQEHFQGTWGEPGIVLQLNLGSLNLFLGSRVMGTEGKDLRDSSNSTVIEMQGIDPYAVLPISQAALG